MKNSAKFRYKIELQTIFVEGDVKKSCYADQTWNDRANMIFLRSLDI